MCKAGVACRAAAAAVTGLQASRASRRWRHICVPACKADLTCLGRTCGEMWPRSSRSWTGGRSELSCSSCRFVIVDSWPAACSIAYRGKWPQCHGGAALQQAIRARQQDISYCSAAVRACLLHLVLERFLLLFAICCWTGQAADVLCCDVQQEQEAQAAGEAIEAG